MKKSKSPSAARKKVLIVDDHPLLREGLRQVIDQQTDLVVAAEAGDAPAALRAMEQHRPDIALVDISLPGRDGLELTKELQARYPRVPVLVLSMHREEVYAERALRAGARGYLMKAAPTETLLRAIRQVLAGHIMVGPTVLDRVLTRSTGKGSRAGLSPLDCLTDRELEVFRLMGQGLQRTAIAEQLKLSVKTIEAHRANIRQKLGLRNVTELLHQAIEFVREEAAGLHSR